MILLSSVILEFGKYLSVSDKVFLEFLDDVEKLWVSFVNLIMIFLGFYNLEYFGDVCFFVELVKFM